MPSYIKNNFEPDEATINKLRQEGISADFLAAMVTPAFCEYWIELRENKDKKGKKAAWQTCYRRWARRAFSGKQGREWEDRHKHQQRKGGMCNDLFEQILDRLDPAPKIVETTTDAAPKYYRLPDPPEPGPSMNPEDALKQALKIIENNS